MSSHTSTRLMLAARAADLDAALPPPVPPDRWRIPPGTLYLDGNSLGPCSVPAEAAVRAALDGWAAAGVLGWSDGEAPWFDLAERVAARLAPLVGAHSHEVVVGGTTTQQLHQLLGTFYRPTPTRFRLVIEHGAFPTDRHAVDSQVAQHGLDPAQAVAELPLDGRGWLAPDAVAAALGPDVAMAVLPGVVYTTGQRLPVAELTAAARRAGVRVVWDLSHSAGLVPHRLHDEAELAVFCTYKYLNGGPGAPAAAFVHEALLPVTPAYRGWWGSDKSRQFSMEGRWTGAAGAGALQLGTPSVLALAALAGSLELFDGICLEDLLERARQLTDFLAAAADGLLAPWGVRVATPREPAARAGHIALAHPEAAALSLALRDRRVIVDYRPPNLLRLAPAPLYIRAADVLQAIEHLADILDRGEHAQYAERAARAAVT